MRPFTPNSAGTVNLSASTSSGTVSLGAKGDQLRLYNSGTVTVFYEVGAAGVSASASTAVPLPSGAVEVISISEAHTTLAAITASSTATIYATRGNGL